MNDKTENEINALQTGLEKVPEQDAVPIQPPEQLLRERLLGFVSGQVDEIKELDSIIRLSLQNLRDRLAKNEIAPNDVLSIINTLSNKKTDLATALLDPFKTAPGGTNVLMPPAKESTDMSDIQKGIQSMSPEQLKLFDKMFRGLQG